MQPSPTGWVRSGNKPYKPPSKSAIAFWVILIFLIGYQQGGFLAGVQ